MQHDFEWVSEVTARACTAAMATMDTSGVSHKEQMCAFLSAAFATAAQSPEVSYRQVMDEFERLVIHALCVEDTSEERAAKDARFMAFMRRDVIGARKLKIRAEDYDLLKRIERRDV